jgi:hypothetical protein
MNTQKAKVLRRKIYGDQSQHAQRIYHILPTGQVINDPKGLRAQYLRAKVQGTAVREVRRAD